MFQKVWPKIRDHFNPQPVWAKRLEAQINCVLANQIQIIQLEGKIMSAITDLQTALDAIVPQVTTIATGVTSIEAQLAALQNTTTSTLSPTDQTALTQAAADVASIKTALAGIQTSLPAPAPAPAAGS